MGCACEAPPAPRLLRDEDEEVEYIETSDVEVHEPVIRDLSGWTDEQFEAAGIPHLYSHDDPPGYFEFTQLRWGQIGLLAGAVAGGLYLIYHFAHTSR